jgi:hypothetical protein
VFTLIPVNVDVGIDVDFQFDLYFVDAVQASLEARSSRNSACGALVEADLEIGTRFIMDLYIENKPTRTFIPAQASLH